jgi:hypothetical protein
MQEIISKALKIYRLESENTSKLEMTDSPNSDGVLDLENLDLYFYITLEGWGKEDVADFPGEYDWDYEEGPFFEDVLSEVVLGTVKEKLRLYYPLLEKTPLASLTIGADIMGMGDSEAMCISQKNSNGTISINIIFGPEILEDLLKAYWDKSHTPNDYRLLVIDHELIHLMDYKELPSFDNPNSEDPLFLFLAWLRAWRAEGLANLIPFLLKTRGLQEGEAVKNRIEKDFMEMQEVNWMEIRSPFALEDIRKNWKYSPYEVGPWLMARMIEERSGIELIGKEFDYQDAETINQILRVGLSIELEEYLKSLTELKIDTDYILDRKLFQDLIQKASSASKEIISSSKEI